MVHLRRQLLETRTERDRLNRECYNWTRTKTEKMTKYSCFVDDLTMVKGISSAVYAYVD